MADIVSVIAQRNHAVICDLYHGFNFLSQVLVRDLGPFERNFDLAIRYTGDALQKFTELGFAVDGDAKQFPEMKNLAEVLGEKFKVFPDFTSDSVTGSRFGLPDTGTTSPTRDVWTAFASARTS